MGTRIEATATAYSRRRPILRGARRLADEAGKRCLERSARAADDIDVLVNVGLYRERNLAEPALASMIQEDLGANPGHPPRLGHHGTFSFDLLNGGCGAVNAAHVIDGLMRAGSARLGLVVAGDGDPSPRTSRGFPFGRVGGALLLSHDDGPLGFTAFAFRTFDEHAAAFDVRLQWEARGWGPMSRRRGRNAIVVREDPDYATHAVQCAAAVARELLAAGSVDRGDVDLLIASQHPTGFATRLAQALELPRADVPAAPPALADAHTAAPIVALEAAFSAGLMARARHCLIVTVGAGINVAAALYRGGG